MTSSNEFEVIYKGNCNDFEDDLLRHVEQECRIGKPGIWCQVADVYARQLTIIRMNPYPEEIEGADTDETFPSIKHIKKNSIYNNFFRWGIPGGITGNHRIVYAIHNYSKVVLLFHFNKKYNGSIKRADLLPAELTYSRYCMEDPNLY